MAIDPTQSAPTGVLLDLLNERIRQKAEEGWTDEHDDHHVHGELARAAACYAAPIPLNDDDAPLTWPWDKKWWKSTSQRRNLVKAGALIIAEIERLDRAAKP